jgi:PRTRC genetic system protein E
MFQQLVPLPRQRSVLLTVASLEDDQIRVNVIPKKLKEGENDALTTPMSFTGTAAELDEQLPDAIVSFVSSHLELKNTLARAREEMDAAAKAAQEEVRNKAKNNKKPSSESAGKVDAAAEEEQKKEPEPPRTPGLFDHPTAPQPAPKPTRVAPVAATATLASATETGSVPTSDEEDEILAEIKAPHLHGSRFFCRTVVTLQPRVADIVAVALRKKRRKGLEVVS